MYNMIKSPRPILYVNSLPKFLNPKHDDHVQVLAVFGATGQQGGSVISYVLNEPELSKQYKIRAITRDVTGDKAKQLNEKNVEVVSADMSDRSSIETALTGVDTTFVMTPPSFAPNGLEVEYNNGKTIADMAVEKGVQYLIFSTLTPVNEISGGKYTHVTAFDAKAKVEQYIRGLPIKSAFYCAGSFMQNYYGSFLTPKKGPDGTYVLSQRISPKTRIPLIDAVRDSGTFVGAILASPEKYEGKKFCSAKALYSLEEIAATMSKTTGQPVVYKQCSIEEFRAMMPPIVAEVFVEGFSFYEEYGYFGPGMEENVEWAVENARGELTTLEEYMTAHPLELA